MFLVPNLSRGESSPEDLPAGFRNTGSWSPLSNVGRRQAVINIKLLAFIPKDRVPARSSTHGFSPTSATSRAKTSSQWTFVLGLRPSILNWTLFGAPLIAHSGAAVLWTRCVYWLLGGTEGSRASPEVSLVLGACERCEDALVVNKTDFGDLLQHEPRKYFHAACEGMRLRIFSLLEGGPHLSYESCTFEVSDAIFKDDSLFILGSDEDRSRDAQNEARLDTQSPFRSAGGLPK